MKRIAGFTLTVLPVAVLLGTVCSSIGSAASLDGKSVFLSQKCNLCHSVSTAGIEATTKSAALKGPDLVNIQLDATAVTKYLRNETTLNGKKHRKNVKLSDGDMKALVDWIRAQRK